MAKLFNRAKMDTSTTGSGTITLGSAVSGYQSFADAGVSNGDVVQYVIEDGANWEIGTGTYSATGTSLTRSPTESSSGGAAISLTGTASVFISAVADDLNRLQNAGSTKIEATASGVDVTGNISVSGTVDGRDISADGSKLDGIESGATADQTASEILTAIKTVDGASSGLDADLLDGNHASAFAVASHTHAFNDLTGKTSGTGDYQTAGKFIANSYVRAGNGSGGVSLTHNDGYGNANVTFNHEAGVPEQNGNAGRIEVNTDTTSDASMTIELKSNVTGGSAVSLVTAAAFSDTDQILTYAGSNKLQTSSSGVDVTGTLTTDNITLDNGAADGGNLTFYSSGYAAWNIDNNYGRLRAYVSGSEKFSILANGRVGIGTTSPEQPLHVNGSIKANSWYRSTGNNGWYSDTYGGGIYMTDTTYVRTYNNKAFYVSNTGNYAIYSNGAVRANGYVISNDFQNRNSDMRFRDLAGGVICYFDESANTWLWRPDGTNERLRLNNTGLGVKNINPSVALDVNGSIEYTGTITDVSDDRLKENKVQITGALDAIKSLTGYTYNMVYEDENQTEMGLIAQDVQAVLPVAVKNIKVDTDGDGTDEDYLGVSYIQLIAPMIEAMKEQQQQIEAMQARIDALEAAT